MSIITVPYLEYFIFSDIRFVSIGSDGSKCSLHSRKRLDILCLSAYHERHVVLQSYVAISSLRTSKQYKNRTKLNGQ